MKYLPVAALVYAFGAYMTFILAGAEDRPYHNDLEMATAIALVWPVYAVKYIALAIWYVLSLMGSGVANAF